MNNKKTNISNLATTATEQKIQSKKTDIQHPELWNFPMDYPLSIIGHEGHKDTLLDEVKLILGSLFPEFDLASLTINPSRTGRFHSVRANVYLTEAEQVNSLYKMLDEAASIRTVL